MNRKDVSRIEKVGWLFWSVAFAVLVAPCFYAVSYGMEEHTPLAERVGIAVVAAAVGAGLVSWPVNSIVQAHLKRQREMARKLAKKK